MSNDKQALAENTRVQGEAVATVVYTDTYDVQIGVTWHGPILPEGTKLYTHPTPANGEAALPASGDVEQRATSGEEFCERIDSTIAHFATPLVDEDGDTLQLLDLLAGALGDETVGPAQQLIRELSYEIAALRSQGQAVAVDGRVLVGYCHPHNLTYDGVHRPYGKEGDPLVRRMPHSDCIPVYALAQQANKETDK